MYNEERTAQTWLWRLVALTSALTFRKHQLLSVGETITDTHVCDVVRALTRLVFLQQLLCCCSEEQ